MRRKWVATLQRKRVKGETKEVVAISTATTTQRISKIRKITDYPNLEPMGPATIVELGADEVQF